MLRPRRATESSEKKTFNLRVAGWLDGVAQVDFQEEVASELASEAQVELELVVKGMGGKIPSEGDAGLAWESGRYWGSSG